MAYYQQQQPQQPQPQQQQQQQPQPQQQQQQQQQRKKKVMFSEPHPSGNTKSPMWDSDSDHMLSYFMDSNGVASPPVPNPAQFASGGGGGGVDYRPVISDRILQHPFRTQTSHQGVVQTIRRQQQNQNQSSGLNINERIDVDDVEDDHQRPPPTPVIQHYFPSSSSSSGTSATATTITSSGIHLSQQTQQLSQPYFQHYQHQNHHQQQQQYQQQHQQQQHIQYQRQLEPIQSIKASLIGPIGNRSNNNSLGAFQGYNPGMEEGTSPMSPALEFIGGDHEPLLLPPVEDGKQETRQESRRRPEWSTQINNNNNGGITANTNEYVMSYGNSRVMQTSNNNNNIINNNNNLLHQGNATTTSSASASAQMPLQLHTEDHTTQETVSSSDVSANTTSFASQPNNVASALHPVAAAALAAGGVNSPFFFPHVSIAYLRQKVESIEETEEKRAKRLERNRESARKSRRRKKERLSNLGGKVDKLYSRMETERRIQINSMLDSIPGNFEKEQLLQLKEVYDTTIQGEQNRSSYDDERIREMFSSVLIDQIEPSILKEVVEFQYNSLNQHLLQRYQKFILWLITQSESYFLFGKEEHSKRDQFEKISTGKISSKQLGEEITNGRKQEGVTTSKKKKKKKDDDENANQQTAQASDAGRMWPLACFELSISVEQEDRLLQAHKRVQEDGDSFRKDGCQIAAATRLTSSLKEAVLYQLYAASFRKRKAYLDILTPRQTILYQEWLISNRDRSKEVLNNKRKRSSSSTISDMLLSSTTTTTTTLSSSSPGSTTTRDENLTLEKLCQYLEESLKVSKNQSC